MRTLTVTFILLLLCLVLVESRRRKPRGKSTRKWSRDWWSKSTKKTRRTEKKKVTLDKCAPGGCWRNALKACGIGRKNHKCRVKSTEKCMVSCKVEISSVPVKKKVKRVKIRKSRIRRAVVAASGKGTAEKLGCDKHDCRLDAFITCGVGTIWENCRQDIFWHCRAKCGVKRPAPKKRRRRRRRRRKAKKGCSQVTCREKAFAKCGAGNKNHKCRRSAFRSCRRRCGRKGKKGRKGRKGKKRSTRLARCLSRCRRRKGAARRRCRTRCVRRTKRRVRRKRSKCQIRCRRRRGRRRARCLRRCTRRRRRSRRKRGRRTRRAKKRLCRRRCRRLRGRARRRCRRGCRRKRRTGRRTRRKRRRSLRRICRRKCRRVRGRARRRCRRRCRRRRRGGKRTRRRKSCRLRRRSSRSCKRMSARVCGLCVTSTCKACRKIYEKNCRRPRRQRSYKTCMRKRLREMVKAAPNKRKVSKHRRKARKAFRTQCREQSKKCRKRKRRRRRRRRRRSRRSRIRAMRRRCRKRCRRSKGTARRRCRKRCRRIGRRKKRRRTKRTKRRRRRRRTRRRRRHCNESHCRSVSFAVCGRGTSKKRCRARAVRICRRRCGLKRSVKNGTKRPSNKWFVDTLHNYHCNINLLSKRCMNSCNANVYGVCYKSCFEARRLRPALGSPKRCKTLCRTSNLDICSTQCIAHRRLVNGCLGQLTAHLKKKTIVLHGSDPCLKTSDTRYCVKKCESNTDEEGCVMKCMSPRITKCRLALEKKRCVRGKDVRKCVRSCRGKPSHPCIRDCLDRSMKRKGCKVRKHSHRHLHHNVCIATKNDRDTCSKNCNSAHITGRLGCQKSCVIRRLQQKGCDEEMFDDQQPMPQCKPMESDTRTCVASCQANPMDQSLDKCSSNCVRHILLLRGCPTVAPQTTSPTMNPKLADPCLKNVDIRKCAKKCQTKPVANCMATCYDNPRRKNEHCAKRCAKSDTQRCVTECLILGEERIGCLSMTKVKQTPSPVQDVCIPRTKDVRHCAMKCKNMPLSCVSGCLRTRIGELGCSKSSGESKKIKLSKEKAKETGFFVKDQLSWEEKRELDFEMGVEEKETKKTEKKKKVEKKKVDKKKKSKKSKKSKKKKTSKVEKKVNKMEKEMSKLEQKLKNKNKKKKKRTPIRFSREASKSIHSAFKKFKRGVLGQSVKKFSIEKRNVTSVIFEIGKKHGGWERLEADSHMSRDGDWSMITTTLGQGKDSFEVIILENVDGGVVQLVPHGEPSSNMAMTKPHAQLFCKINPMGKATFDNIAFQVVKGKAIPRWAVDVRAPKGVKKYTAVGRKWLKKVNMKKQVTGVVPVDCLTSQFHQYLKSHNFSRSSSAFALTSNAHKHKVHHSCRSRINRATIMIQISLVEHELCSKGDKKCQEKHQKLAQRNQKRLNRLRKTCKTPQVARSAGRIDCDEEIAQWHYRQEDINRKLSSLYARAARCNNTRCITKILKKVRIQHDKLAALPRPRCAKQFVEGKKKKTSSKKTASKKASKKSSSKPARRSASLRSASQMKNPPNKVRVWRPRLPSQTERQKHFKTL